VGLGCAAVLRADRRGLPLGYTPAPGNEHEYEPLLDLIEAGETVIADKGLWGTHPRRLRRPVTHVKPLTK
jgi:hypothetical protein